VTAYRGERGRSCSRSVLSVQTCDSEWSPQIGESNMQVHVRVLCTRPEREINLSPCYTQDKLWRHSVSDRATWHLPVEHKKQVDRNLRYARAAPENRGEATEKDARTLANRLGSAVDSCVDCTFFLECARVLGRTCLSGIRAYELCACVLVLLLVSMNSPGGGGPGVGVRPRRPGPRPLDTRRAIR
jgi:hypothetical protein